MKQFRIVYLDVVSKRHGTAFVDAPNAGSARVFFCERFPTRAIELVKEEDPPDAACERCGGWTNFGGMSQHSKATTPIDGRLGCTCFGGTQ